MFYFIVFTYISKIQIKIPPSRKKKYRDNEQFAGCFHFLHFMYFNRKQAMNRSSENFEWNFLGLNWNNFNRMTGEIAFILCVFNDVKVLFVAVSLHRFAQVASSDNLKSDNRVIEFSINDNVDDI